MIKKSVLLQVHFSLYLIRVECKLVYFPEDERKSTVALYLIRVECKFLYGRQDKPDNAETLYLIRVECKYSFQLFSPNIFVLYI